MKNHNPIRLREAWVLCFLLGVVMLNYPFLQIFNKETLVFGIPLLFLYFFIGWPLSIFVIYLFVKHLESGQAQSDSDRKDPPSQS